MKLTNQQHAAIRWINGAVRFEGTWVWREDLRLDANLAVRVCAHFNIQF